jgi:hypothetical protein
MATYDFDVAVEPSYVDFIDIAAGYGVLSIPVDGILQGDYVQTATLTIADASGTVIVSKAIDMTQRSDGFFEFRTQYEVDLHFSLSSADVAAIAAASSPRYSSSLYVMRNGVTVPREVQAGNIAARSASVIPALIASSITITGGPVTGEPMTTAQLTGTVRDGFGNIVPLTITWASTNPSLASVDVNGLVTFINPGAVTISATCQGLTATTTATTSVLPLAPSDGDVAFYIAANSRWEPHQPAASRIKPGTFSGTSGDVYAFPGPVGLGGHTYTFPASDHAGYFLQSDGVGNLAWALPLEDIALTDLSDVTITAAATGQFLKKSAGNWVNAFIVSADVTDATSSNTASRVVVRDGSGNFAGGTITAATGISVTTGGVTVSAGSSSFQGFSATTGVFSTSLTVSAGGITVTGNSTITGTLGGITTLSATTGSFTTVNGTTANFTTLNGALGHTLTFGTHLTGTSFNNAADVTIATDATSANTVSTIVARDASGNVALGTLTSATGIAVTTGGITVSAGVSALQGMTATTGVFSSTVSAVGLSSSSGFTVSSGASSVQALSAAGDFAIATNKFTVAAASGNTLIAGTLGVTGQITGNVTGNLTGNVTGALTGNASTATAWQTARTIWGQSIDGTANVSGALTVATGGITVTLGGITVSAGTSAFQATTTTTLTASGLLAANAGATVANGQTLTLTGATVAGTPTWSSAQAITLSTAAQPNVTSVGTLTSITTSGALTFTAAAAKIIPGATSISLRNTADNADNLLITDAGAVTTRSTLTVSAGGLTVTSGGATVSSGTTAVQALTATTGAFSSTLLVTGTSTLTGNVGIGAASTASAGLMVASSVNSVAGLTGGELLLLNGTITATADNAISRGLFINPTFADGGFTGVSHYAIQTRVSNALVFSGTDSTTWNVTFRKDNTNGSPVLGTNLLTQFVIANSNSQAVFGLVQNGSGYGDFVWAGYTGSNAQWMRLVAGGALTVANGVTVTAGGLTVSAGTSAVQALTATTGVFSSTVAMTALTATTGAFSSDISGRSVAYTNQALIPAARTTTGPIVYSVSAGSGGTAGNLCFQLGDSAGNWAWLKADVSAVAMSLTNAGALTVAAGLGINGKTPVTNVAAPTAAGATYTATEQTLLNDIRTRLINFGIYT